MLANTTNASDFWYGEWTEGERFLNKYHQLCVLQSMISGGSKNSGASHLRVTVLPSGAQVWVIDPRSVLLGTIILHG